MRTNIKIAALVLVGVLLLSPLGCKPKKVAATVNGEKVYVEDIEKQLASLERQHTDAFAGEQGAKMKKEFTQSILDNLILEKLLMAQAETMKIKATDKEIKDKEAQVKAMFGTEAEYKKALKDEGMDAKALKESLTKQVILEKISTEITKGIKVTDAQIQQEYEANKAQYMDPEMVKAAHILVDSEETAKKIKEEYEDGADFAELAKQYSKDEGTKDKGGDLGEFKKGQMVKEFEDAAFGMKVGEVSDPIKSQFGYHIIKVTGKTPPRQKTLEEVKKELTDQVQKTLASEKFKQYTNALKSKADIKINKFQ